MFLLVACSLAVACVPRATPSAVEARIEEFLLAVRDQADGIGWDHLRGEVRASYPGGRDAWVRAMGAGDTSRMRWRIEDVSVDDAVGCGRVEFGDSRQHVPSTLFDDRLPALARVASDIGDGRFFICATVAPFPLDGGVHGVG
jgi:hypothetical protein